ncbi:hypothetical protein Aab01nite_32100 [Paractinoplanes abujensis]|uniref:Mini-circle protein n=1 Tax=Paractinoplanes abujensis TaxID=882441 RepID=A0A7W7D318_9ACTN|nr:DinB family protein [Actinoplanes abujensis]MBB4697896.1 hypothetical protein [Actinoplanes abujensis]GID19620.1 hypothetical protein Aab01nite_32100 [Actinoplanes abujensis]
MPAEKSVLLDVLDGLRDSIAGKLDGVPEPQVRTAGVASGTNLLGLIKHLTYVERFYFLGEPITNLNRTLRPTRTETVDGILAGYREAIEESNRVIGSWRDLDEHRWTLVHMIEETGRHAGHADILREQIDGATGR